MSLREKPSFTQQQRPRGGCCGVLSAWGTLPSLLGLIRSHWIQLFTHEMQRGLKRWYPNSGGALGRLWSRRGGGRVRKHRPLLISLKSKMPFLQKEQLSYLPWHKCKEQSHFSGRRGHTLRTWDMGKAFFSISNDPVSPFLDANVYLV